MNMFVRQEDIVILTFPLDHTKASIQHDGNSLSVWFGVQDCFTLWPKNCKDSFPVPVTISQFTEHLQTPKV